MAFSFSNAVSGGGGFGGRPSSSGAPIARDGPELREIQTDKLGFSAINGAAQLRLLPAPWPPDALPPPSASLLAVASRKGLLAAAGPDAIYLASTQSVRAKFREKTTSETNNVRPFDPQMNIPYPRPRHIAFSADESTLVASTQDQGGVDVFQLNKLGNGQIAPALEISTSGKGLRALNPNPSIDYPYLFAVVTNDGELLMADLQAGALKEGKNGYVLKSGVTCCSWSNKGKQLLTGGATGAVTQMKPDGTIVAEIPKSTSIPDGCHVSGISWLENDSFFIIYTPSDVSNGLELSEYFIVTREPKTTNFTFQKLPEVVGAFGVERIPSFHFITRLRNFPPHIQDMLVMTASTSTDVGLVTKADEGLSRDDPVVNDYTFTVIGDDSRRAQLPMSQDMEDTTPIGMALDLSSSEKVPNPIPADVEIIETPGPVPNILVLTNEGHLLSWWLIYDDSVRENTLFSGFEGITTASSDSELSPPPMTSEPESEKASAASTAFGQSSFASAFTKPTLSTFGSANSQSAFGSSSEGEFGKPSTIGGSKPSWTSTGFGSGSSSQTGRSGFGQPGFGQPGFGSAPLMGGSTGSAFGSASALGSHSSGFGQPATAPSSTFGKPSPFGSSTFGNASASSPFATTAAKAPGSSGFASFSQSGGFGSASKGESSPSPFAKASGDNVFGKPSQDSPFGTKTSGFGFGTTNAGSSKSPLGAAGGFKLESSFKGDGTAKDDLPKPKEMSAFGLSSLDDTLGDSHQVTSPTHDKEEEMGDDHEGVSSEEEKQKEALFTGFSPENQKQPPQTLVTPPSTLSQSKATPAQPVSSLFGTSSEQSTTPLAPSTSTGWTFGQVPSTTPKDTPAQPTSTTPKETPAPSQKMLFGTRIQAGNAASSQNGAHSTPVFSDALKPSSDRTPTAEAPKIKQEPPSDDESIDLAKIPQAPLPPDPISKPRYASGDTSVSSLNSKLSESPPDDAPLPPDFLPANKSAAKPTDEQALASDGEEGEADEEDLSSDFEGSGEDDDEDISPIEEPTDEQTEQVQTSPESSLKSGEKSPETSPTGGRFTKVSTNTSQKPVRPLFGEVGTTGTILPPPKPQQSPRSPSPVRNLPPTSALRTESSRSVSAPAHPRSIIDKRKTEHAQSQMAIQAARAREEEIAKQKAIKDEQARIKEQAEAEELQRLEDNEDERLRNELQAPVRSTVELDDFVTYQPKASEEGSKSGIPAQIERLYQDINSMVYTLGINARSLSAFIKYQQEQQPNDSWPSVLKSETPMDALNDEQVLDDISKLHEGHDVLEAMLDGSQIHDLASKLQQCQNMLSQDLLDLRTKLASVRKTLTIKSALENTLSAPLSAEQSSIQQDLRKSSALAQSRLVQTEDSLSVLHAKLAELAPSEQASHRQSMFGASEPRKKPTVEAVSNTIAKMTAMAEKKSADIDVLEAQLRKLDMRSPPANRVTATPNGTPSKGPAHMPATTPNSGKSSVYLTPNSKLGSTRSTPGRKLTANGAAVMISAEERERWQIKARRKKEMASILKDVLDDRRKGGSMKT